jgi:small basic protein
VSLRRSQKWFDTISIIGVLVAGFCTSAAGFWCWQQDITYLIAFVVSAIVALGLAYLKKPLNLTLLIAIAVSIGINLFF